MDRNNLLELYSSAFDDLIKTLEETPKVMWKFKPAPNKWSVHEVIIHIADSEANSFCRARKIICESGSTIFAYDENAWAAKIGLSFSKHRRLFAVIQTVKRNDIQSHQKSAGIRLDEFYYSSR